MCDKSHTALDAGGWVLPSLLPILLVSSVPVAFQNPAVPLLTANATVTNTPLPVVVVPTLAPIFAKGNILYQGEPPSSSQSVDLGGPGRTYQIDDTVGEWSCCTILLFSPAPPSPRGFIFLLAGLGKKP
jgi:hypothetical protein